MHCRLLTSTETQLPENATSFGNKNKENPNMGVIVAIVIFIAIVIIALIVACFIYLHRKKNIKKKENKKSSSFKNISEEEMLGMFQILYLYVKFVRIMPFQICNTL